MRHRVYGKKLNRSVGERNALRRTLITQLFDHEQIETTRAKAEAIRSTAEHMITQAKRSLKHEDPMRQVHIRRLLNARLNDKNVVEKVFTEFAPRYENRPGGYTRMYKLVPRKGDQSEMVLLQLVDRPTNEEGKASGAEATPNRARSFLDRLRGRSQATASADTAATDAAPVSESKVSASDKDKLTRIEGIGPKVQDALYEHGITTFAQLAAMTPEEIVRVVKEEKGVRMVGDGSTWPKQAQMIVDGDEAGLKAYQDRLVGGREPNA